MGVKLMCVKSGSEDFKKGKTYEVSNNLVQGYNYENIEYFNNAMLSKFEVVEEEHEQTLQQRLCEIINTNEIENSYYCRAIDGSYFLKVNFKPILTWSEWTEAKHKSYSYRRKGNTIQVKSNVTGYKAQAKCSPCDEFDLEKGIIICLLRIRLKELTR